MLTQISGQCVGHTTSQGDLLSSSAGPVDFEDRGCASQFDLQLIRENIISNLRWNVSAGDPAVPQSHQLESR